MPALSRQTLHRFVALLVVALLVTSVLPVVTGLATAQDTPLAPGDDEETRTGGVVTVAQGETVDGSLQAAAGTVLVAGTVDGNLEAVGGTVLISGTVTGNVQAVAGSVTIEGTVEGDVDAFGGSVVVRDGGRIGGSLEAAAGSVRLDGDVAGNARLGAEAVVLGPTAVVGGTVEYDADRYTTEPGATVRGPTIRNDDLTFTVGSPFGVGSPDFLRPTVSPLAAVGYPFLANLLLGVCLLVLVPRFSANVVTVGEDEPLTSGGVGLVTVVAVPLLLALLLFTIVGIPLSFVGFAGYLFALWVGQVYGGYLLGTVALDAAGVRSHWVALGLGLAVLALLSLLPLGVGGVLQAIATLVGLGALVIVLADWVREQRA